MSVLGVFLNREHGFSKLPQPSITLLQGLGVEGDCHLGRTTQHLWRLPRYASEPNLRQVHLIQSELLDEPDFHGEDGVRVQPGEMGENVSTAGIDLLALGCGTRLHFVDASFSQAEFDRQRYRVLGQVLALAWKCLCFETMLINTVYGVCWTSTIRAIWNSAQEAMFIHEAGFWSVIVLGVILLCLGVKAGFHSIMVGLMTCIVVVLLGYQLYTRKDPFGEHAVITITGLRHPCKKVDKFRPGLKEKCVVRGGEKNGIIGRKAGVMAVVTKGGTVKPGMKIVVERTLWFKELPVLH